jgi:hypothetical protein
VHEQVEELSSIDLVVCEKLRPLESLQRLPDRTRTHAQAIGQDGLRGDATHAQSTRDEYVLRLE